MSQQTNLPPLPVSEQRRYLDAYVANKVSRFHARAEPLSPTSVVLVYGGRTNHVLHAILSVLTLGAWLLVWLALALIGKPSRTVATVDAWGRVREQ